ncbi:MAG: M1 family metallopeptidase, partial [Crocinitomicaceae bacterium]
MKKISLILSCAIIFISACKSVEKVNSSDELTEEVQFSPEDELVDFSEYEGDFEQDAFSLVEDETPTVRAIYNPSRTLWVDLVHTKLEVSFDWGNSKLLGKATLTMKPHFYNTDSVTLDAKAMDINSVSLNGRNLSFTYDDQLHLRIKLDKEYKKDEKFTLLVDYVAKPEERETNGSAAITSDKGLYFINPKGEDSDKIPQIWTQGETEANSVWFPTIDAPNAKTSQEIYITVEEKFLTLSNGKLVSSKKNGNGTRTDYWKQDQPHAPYL